MSGNIGPKIVVTGITEDKYEYIWKIQNWLKIRKTEKLVTDQKFTFDTGKASACPSKWMIGLKMHNSSTIRYYCTLLENLGNKTSVDIKFSVDLLHKNGTTNICFSEDFTLKVNESCEATTHVSFGGDASRCLPWLDSDGSLVARVAVSLYRPIKDVKV